MNLRAIPAPTDPNESALRDAGHEAIPPLSIRFNAVLRRKGLPHIEIFPLRDKTGVPIATFSRATKALDWIEGTYASQTKYRGSPP